MTDAHDLYGLPLDRFVAERRALAKALRARGQRELAVSVTGRRKPSVAAWAVNQLVRTQGRAVASLFDAGDALQRTQSELLAGRGEAGAMRAATEAERAAVRELTDAARGLLSSEGHELTPATLDRVSATLHAAALDDDARAEMREGCLERELRHVGLGGVAMSGSPDQDRVRGRAPGKAARPEPVPSSAKATSAPQRDAERRAKAARAETLKAVRQAEAAARRDAERAGREVESAEKQRERAATSLHEAEAALAAARQRAEGAALEHRRTLDALDEA